MMAAALIGISRNNHIAHHFVNPRIFLFLLILKKFPEKLQKDSVFKPFLLIPMAVPIIFPKFAKRGLNDTKRKGLGNLIVSEDRLLYSQNDLLLHYLVKLL